MKVFVILLLPIILGLALGSSVLSTNPVFGLSCAMPNMTGHFEETDTVFLGKALSKEYQPNPRHEDRFDAVTLFSIIESYKGIYQKEISVISSEWLWGVNFTENSDYVVFANNNDERFEHALCTLTQLASESNLPEIRKISQNYILTPLVQLEFGANPNEIKCKENLVLIQKYDGTPACVTPETKEKLIERGWVKTTILQEIDDSSDSLNLNIARIEDGRISLHPENTCASLDLNRLTAQDIQRYKNDEKGLDENNILQITSKDLKEIPNIQELIYAVHSIEFPYNKYSSASLDGMTFVEYELFLMDKSMKKYGDSKGDYFKKLDGDYEERLTNPAKQGFTNHFEAPVILYNDDAYSVSGTYFWTSDEHEPRRMSFFPIDDINDDEKFITLTDEDMKSVPKIKDAIASIGTIKESVSASKGLPEDQWNQYREWFKQKSQDSLNSDRFRLIQYDNHLYSIGFGIC
jgi:hypothetical protein